MTKESLTAPAEWEGLRIDKCVSESGEGLSRSYVQRLIREGKVLAGGEPVKASYQVRAGDLIEYTVPDAAEPDILPEDIPLSILYEDQDVIVVDKPKGMVVHPAAGHYAGTLVNALLYHCGGGLSGINGVMRPGIVHRIDKDTTGAVMACKNDAAHRAIAEQLKNHTVHRLYRAIVCGVFREDEGVVDVPLGRHPRDRKKMAVVAKGGKDAVTHYRVLKRYRNHAYIECRLETGRTHQIRVHMASIGHPVLGDEVYCPGRGMEGISRRLQGQTLHAMTLGFTHPVSGRHIETVAPLPEYFVELLESLP